MSLSDHFLEFVDQLVKSHLEKLKLTVPEELEIQNAIYAIFEENYDVNEIHSQLVEFCDTQLHLKPLSKEISKHFNSHY